jgi:hypothetical protein
MTDVMIDFETLGNGKNAAVCQVGACYFDRKTGEIGAQFKRNIDARTSVESGAELDADTVYWWLSQSKEAIESFTLGDLTNIRTAFEELNTFLSQAEAIWSHATFDFVILMETLKRLRIKPLFAYRTARDIRTLVDIAGVSAKDPRFVREGTHHDALDDCFFQTKYCVAALQRLEPAR